MVTDTSVAAPSPPPEEPRPPEGAAPLPTEAGERLRARRSRRYRRDPRWSPYALIAPFFLFIAAFGLFPLLYTGWASLHRVELTAPGEMEWVGLRNFGRQIVGGIMQGAVKG